MAEKDKQVNFRINDTELESFKAYAEEHGLSQTEAFNLAFTALKAEKKKDEQPTNKKNIAEAQRHANCLVDIVMRIGDEKAKADQNAEDKYSGQIEELTRVLEEKKVKLQELEKVKTELEKELENTKKSLELANTKQELDKTTWEKSIAQIKLEAAEEKKPLELRIAELEGRLQERKDSKKTNKKEGD